jgi:c-di-GMP-binding flagellar brake protein YcgR
MEKSSSSTPLKIVKPAGHPREGRAGSKVKREQIVNALNRINFHNGQVFVTMKHHRFNSFVNVAALPQPCRGENLDLLWCGPDNKATGPLSAYEYQEFFYTDGLKKVRVEALLREAGPAGLVLTLPEAGQEVSQRRCRRFACRPAITVQISQSGLVLQGVLVDYNGYGFAVDMASTPGQALRLINADNPVNVLVQTETNVLFAETCRILRLAPESPGSLMVLAPRSTQITRFKAKEVRSIRQHLTPQPSLELKHPLSGKKVSLRAVDISGSGLAVEEDPSQSQLLPGLVIPKAALVFSNNFRIDCRVQVLFNRAEKDNTALRCGLVFLDMDVIGQMQLSSILYQAKNPHSYVGASVDLDALWDFFFETGFIYPEKYGSFQEQREKFKTLYSRLYNDHPEISRHIIYQDKNIIYGHVSMFRYYDQTWMLHHHAAVKSSQHKAGLVVMDHILQHINEVHNLASTRMRYIACYFRPNNRFAARVFGGAARALANPRKCSLDDFAYGHYQPQVEKPGLPAGWRLEESTADDFTDLQYFYQETSGGLLLEGLDLLLTGLARERELNAQYNRLGLRRERFFFSLRNPAGALAALCVVNISDVGLNMSDLTNCVQILVMEDREISPDLISAVLDELAWYYDHQEVSLLFFPLACAEAKLIPHDKVYQLTVLDLNFISEYLKFMEGLTGSSLRLKSPIPDGRETTL